MKNISYAEVSVGDMIYQSGYYAQNKWREVTNIKRSGDTVSLGIGVSVRDDMDTRTYIVGHAREAIAVR